MIKTSKESAKSKQAAPHDEDDRIVDVFIFTKFLSVVTDL